MRVEKVIKDKYELWLIIECCDSFLQDHVLWLLEPDKNVLLLF